jgi:hypothetical protein
MSQGREEWMSHCHPVDLVTGLLSWAWILAGIACSRAALPLGWVGADSPGTNSGRVVLVGVQGSSRLQLAAEGTAGLQQ